MLGSGVLQRIEDGKTRLPDFGWIVDEEGGVLGVELTKELLILQIAECLMARPVRTVHRLVIFICIKDEVILFSPEMEADAA